jgi:hypothetical protein
VSEILAMTLLMAAIRYVYLRIFTLVLVQSVYIHGEGVVKTQSATDLSEADVLR